MMWPALAIVAVVAAAFLSRMWLRRIRALEKDLADSIREIDRLHDRQALSLERAETERQALFNSMVEGFLLVDRDGRVQTVNQALQNFFSLEGELRGGSILHVFRRNELAELWEKVSRGEQVRNFEL